MTTDSTREGWRQELADAFAALLGRPLSDYDAAATGATYAAVFGGNFMQELRFDKDPGWVSSAVLHGHETLAIDELQLYYLDEAPLRFDGGASVFEFEDPSVYPAAFAAALGAEQTWGNTRIRYIHGRDLGPLLEQHGVDLADPAYEGAWTVSQARIASDGTLLDALRVATGIGDGPDSLVASDDEAEAEWVERLAAVPRAELRAHLLAGCLPAWGGEGLSFYPATEDDEGHPAYVPEGSTLIAYWDESQNQRDVTVLRLG